MAQRSASNTHPETHALVPAVMLRSFPFLVEQLGGDTAELLATAGVSIDADGEVAPGVTFPQLAHLLELSAKRLNCPDFGMRLARAQDALVSHGALGSLMLSAPTFGEALQAVAERSLAGSMAAKVWQREIDGGRRVFMGHAVNAAGVPKKLQATELTLMRGHQGALEMTAGRARTRCVLFRHKPLSAASVYRRYFGCEVRFGQADDGVIFSARDLAAEIVPPAGRTFAEIAAGIEAAFTPRRQPLHSRTRDAILHLLGVSDCTNEAVACALNMHPRTLHRRLHREGTTFQAVKDEVRRHAMLYYLQQTDLEFTLVAEKLGYAEQSVMTRCCRRWFAATPTELRSQHRADLSSLS